MKLPQFNSPSQLILSDRFWFDHLVGPPHFAHFEDLALCALAGDLRGELRGSGEGDSGRALSSTLAVDEIDHPYMECIHSTHTHNPTYIYIYSYTHIYYIYQHLPKGA